jgi:hypothetical protein
MNSSGSGGPVVAAWGCALLFLISSTAVKADESPDDYGWQANWYGPGISGQVNAMIEFEDQLIVAGFFPSVGSEIVNHIAAWDGQQWQAMGGPDSPGFNSGVATLAVFNGELYAGGHFTHAGQTELNHIARWDGDQWQPLPENGTVGVSLSSVDALLEFDGQLVVGGSFTSAGGTAANGLAAWDGSQWSALGSAPGESLSGFILSLAIYQDELVAGGYFGLSGGGGGIARWDGDQWLPLYGGHGDGLIPSIVHAMIVYQDELVVGGNFHEADGQPAYSIARWNGSDWMSLEDDQGNGVGRFDEVNALVIQGDDLVVGGSAHTAWIENSVNLARWNGSQWQPIDPGASGEDSSVFALAVYEETLWVATHRRSSDLDVGLGLVLWDGNQWQSAPESGSSGVESTVRATLMLGDDLVVGGSFIQAGTTSAYGIARWDGLEWRAFDAQNDEPYLWEVNDLILFNDELVVAGGFIAGDHFGGVARWDQAQSRWVELVSPNDQGIAGWVEALTIFDGELIAAGSFADAGGVEVNNIARWDGTQWRALTGSSGTGTSARNHALAIHQGDLIVGGEFSSAGGVSALYLARWTGDQWQPFAATAGPFHIGGGTPGVKALAVHQDEVFAGGTFRRAGIFEVNNIAHYDGEFWRPLEGKESGGTGLPGPSTVREVLSLAMFGSTLVVGGNFAASGDLALLGLATWDGRNWGTVGAPDLNALSARVHHIATGAQPNTMLVAGRIDGIGSAPAWNLAEFRWQTGSVEIIEISDTNPHAGVPVTVTVEATGEPFVPVSGLGVVHASTGESCHSEDIQQLDAITSRFTCNITFSEEGEPDLAASISPSWTHLMTPAEPLSITVQPPEPPLFHDRFENVTK